MKVFWAGGATGLETHRGEACGMFAWRGVGGG